MRPRYIGNVTKVSTEWIMVVPTIALPPDERKIEMGSQDDREKMENDRVQMLAQRVAEIGELTAFLLDPDTPLAETAIGRTILAATGETADDLSIVQVAALIVNRCAEIMALEMKQFPSEILQTMCNMTRTAEVMDQAMGGEVLVVEIGDSAVDSLLNHMRNKANLN